MAVTGLSLVGMAAELTGIVMVSGRGPAVAATYREWWHAFRRRIGRPPPITLEIGRVDETSHVFEIEANLGSDTRLDRIDRRIERLRARADEADQARDALAKRIDASNDALPREIRTHAAAPVGGVVWLVAGLTCFVAANIVGVSLA